MKFITTTLLFLLSFSFLYAEEGNKSFRLFGNDKQAIFTAEELLSGPLDISDFTSVFVDKTGEADIDAIQSIEAGKFIPLASLQLETKYKATNYAYWLHFRLQAEADDLPLVFKCGLHRKVDFYQISSDTTIKQSAGHGNPISQEAHLFPNKYSVKLKEGLKGTQNIYVRITNDLEFKSPTALLLDETYEMQTGYREILPYYIFHAFVFALFLFLILSALSQLAVNRDKVYLYYTLFTAAAFILYYKMFDIANPVFALLPPGLSSYAFLTPFSALPPIPFLLFILAFFNLKEKHYDVYKLIRWAILLSVGFIITDKIIWLFSKEIAWRVGDVFRIVFFIYLIYLSAILFKKLGSINRYFILGFGFAGVCTLTNMLARMTGLIDNPGYWDIPLVFQYIGILGLLFFFGVGLGARSRELQTEQEHLRRNLQEEKNQKELQQKLNELRSTFFTNITHEFRTPLTVITGLAKKSNSPETSAQNNTIIRRNAEKLLNMVNQLLELSKSESDRTVINYRLGDFIAFVNNCTQAFLPLAKEKNIHLEFSTEQEEFIMDFDPGKAEIILSNLLSNAVKFTPEGRQIQVKTASAEGGKYLELQVIDEGIGIEADQLPYIFDRFFQGKGEVRDTGQGTGIGLALLKDLCDKQNIEVQVSSEPGAGTHFTLHFPVQRKAVPVENIVLRERPQVQAIPSSAPTSPEINDERPVVLLVEDNRDVMYYLTSLFREKYQIITAENGQIGLEKAKEHRPDLIISDVMMPVMNGFDLCETLKNTEETDHIPLILLTAKATREDKNRGLYSGADAYIMKPFDEAELSLSASNLIQRGKTLLRKFTKGDISLESPAKPKNSFLSKLDTILAEHYTDDEFNGTALGRLMQQSKSSLYERIKNETGLSVGLYIRAYRLRASKKLLSTEPELSVKELAYRSGFKSPVYFSQEFKKAFKLSPGEFIKKNRLPENN